LKGIVKKIKRQVTDWKKICVTHLSDVGLITRVINNSYNSIGKQKNQLKMGKKL
jgi:hypothetical protein